MKRLLLRYRFSALVFIVCFSVAGVASFLQVQSDRADFRRRIEENAERIGQNLNITVTAQIGALVRMADRWQAAGGTPEPQWRADAVNYLRDLPGLTEMGLYDRSFRALLVEPARHPVLDKNFNNDIDSLFYEGTLDKGLKTHLIPVAGSHDLLAVVPTGATGWLAVAMDGQKLVEGQTSLLAKKYYNVSFDDGRTPDDIYAIYPVQLANSKPFSIIVTPTQVLRDSRASKLPQAILLFGFIGALLLATVAQFVRGSLAQSKALVRQSRAVLESEAMLRLIMQKAPIGMALLSPAGKWLEVNPALCAIVGYTEEELLQTDFQAITHPDDLDADLVNVQDLLEGRTGSYTMPKRYFHKDGSLIWVLLSVALVWNADGTPRSFISQIVNISQIKRADAERERLVQKLVNANAELERFAFVASHDLQEPLRMIFNFTTLLQQDYAPQLDSTARSYIEIATSSATRMRSLIEDLLNYARADHAEAQTEIFDANQTLAYVRQNLAASLAAGQAELVVGDLPQLQGSPMQFASLLQNLIGNAIKYVPAGRQPVVKVAARRSGENWLFTVSDNGIGMKPEYREQVFEPFKRLHNQQEYQGTGMGLAICRKIVSSFGGTIWVESEPGIGSTFCFTVPAIQ